MDSKLLQHKHRGNITATSKTEKSELNSSPIVERELRSVPKLAQDSPAQENVEQPTFDSVERERRPPNSSYSWSSGTSSEPVCRICHENDDVEKLVSPCYCSGSVGLLHISCLERWLGASNLTRCELCKYEFTVKKQPRPLAEFMHDPPSPRHRTNLVCDVSCFVVLTPITIASAYLCANGARYYSQWPDSWRVQGLAALTACLIVIYLSWLILVIHHHYIVCKKWQEENQVVKIVCLDLMKDRTAFHSATTAYNLDPPIPSARPSAASQDGIGITARQSISDSAESAAQLSHEASSSFAKPDLKCSSAQFSNNSSYHSNLLERGVVVLGFNPSDKISRTERDISSCEHERIPRAQFRQETSV